MESILGLEPRKVDKAISNSALEPLTKSISNKLAVCKIKATKEHMALPQTGSMKI